jgi:hypothetical protein
VSDESVWQELEARGATSASVPFSGRAGGGGRVDRIMLHRLDGDEPVDVEWWTSRDELCYALEAPVGIASVPSRGSPGSREPFCGQQQIGAW